MAQALEEVRTGAVVVADERLRPLGARERHARRRDLARVPLVEDVLLGGEAEVGVLGDEDGLRRDRLAAGPPRVAIFVLSTNSIEDT